MKSDAHHTVGHPGNKIGGQSDLHFDNLDVTRIVVKWGVVFMVLQGALLKSRLKNYVHDTGGHLGEIRGGQSDLHFYNLDVRRNIVKWGFIFVGFRVLGSNPVTKTMYT